MSQIQARQQDARQNLAPSVGTYGYVPKVTTLFGIPNVIEPGGVEMDLDRVAWTQGAKASAPTDRRQRNIQAGALASALEHAVPEQMFSTQDEPVEAVSAVKALSIANREGQMIYRIDASNRAEVLPKLSLGRNTMDEIRTALDAGKVVTTHPQKIAVPGWSGAGYVILDPDTGAGAWKIGGGLNGGFLTLLEGVSKAIIWAIATFFGIFKPFIETFSTAAAGLAFFISVLATVFNSSLNTLQKVADIAISLLSGIAVVKLSAAIFSSALLFSAPLAAIGLMAVAILAVALVTIFLKALVINALAALRRPPSNEYVYA